MKIADHALVMLVIMLPDNLLFKFQKIVFAMYKCTFSGTGDGSALKNLDDAYSVVNIEWE